MNLVTSIMFLAAQLSNAPIGFEKSENACLGKWNIEAIKDDNFYSSFRVKYPKVLSVSEGWADYLNTYYYAGQNYEDSGSCNVKTYWDERNASLVFDTCLKSSDPDSSPSLRYKIKCYGTDLSGVVIYRDEERFSFTGNEVVEKLP